MPIEFLMNPTHPSRPRNKIIAQAFFDMGKRIKDDCDKNGNPYPEWSDRYGEFATTYRPRVARGESAERTAERAGEIGESAETTAESREKTNESREKSREKTGGSREKSREKTGGSREKSREKILVAIKENSDITIAELARVTGLSAKGVEKNIRILREENVIRRVGPDKGGHWEVVGFEP